MSLELKHKDVDKVVVKYGGKTIVCQRGSVDVSKRGAKSFVYISGSDGPRGYSMRQYQTNVPNRSVLTGNKVILHNDAYEVSNTKTVRATVEAILTESGRAKLERLLANPASRSKSRSKSRSRSVRRSRSRSRSRSARK